MSLLLFLIGQYMTEQSSATQYMIHQAAAHEVPLLRVDNLSVAFYTDAGAALAVDRVSFAVYAGETLAVVGESGCGKSVTALSLLRLIPDPPGRITSGSIVFDGDNLLELPEAAMRAIRGNDISMIFQEPMTALNPVFRVGAQISAVLRVHRQLSAEEARTETIELLRRVGIPSPERRLDEYPHQMSGGMLQRIIIAMALACNPKILIADEPTTALDVTIQAQILELLMQLQRDKHLAIILITHDLAVVAETAHRVIVMYAGRIVESASVTDLFAVPMHPYTQGLFASLPSVNKPGERLTTIRGNVPPATDFPKGCRFHPRCPHAMPVCSQEEPPLKDGTAAHPVACWLYHGHGEASA